jgi:hypothetical protein
MTHTEDSSALFSREIAPTAWKQIAQLPQEVFVALLARLRILANLASTARHPEPVSLRGIEVETSLSFIVGDFAALYEADFQVRVIRLLEVTRRLPTDPVNAHGDAAASRTSL